jgi:hypothetical protein
MGIKLKMEKIKRPYDLEKYDIKKLLDYVEADYARQEYRTKVGENDQKYAELVEATRKAANEAGVTGMSAKEKAYVIGLARKARILLKKFETAEGRNQKKLMSQIRMERLREALGETLVLTLPEWALNDVFSVFFCTAAVNRLRMTEFISPKEGKE